MHVKRFLHKLLCPVIHQARVKAITEVVLAAVCTKKLVLTQLGRGINTKIQERSGIQKVNRLLGNMQLWKERAIIASQIAHLLLGNNSRPEIIVDWSKYPNSEDAILRAALVAKGRALTFYEERHAVKKMGNKPVQRNFLIHLKQVLPANCQPVLITDAGFHNGWFQDVLRMGWDYIGRIRGLKVCCFKEDKNYFKCKDLFNQAKEQAAYLGEVILTRKNPMQSHMYLVKNQLKGRKFYTKQGKVSAHKDSKGYSRAHREPWLLVSSIGGTNAAKKIQAGYSRRMTIEEGFRDLKSCRYGFGLEEGKTIKPNRRDILLLIAMLASLIAWLTGEVGERLKLHYQFQSNSIKHRRVISLFYLGCQLIKKRILIRLTWVWDVIASLKSEAIYG